MRPIKCRFRDVSRVEISDFASLNSKIQMEPGEEGGKKIIITTKIAGRRESSETNQITKHQKNDNNKKKKKKKEWKRGRIKQEENIANPFDLWNI